MKRIFLIVIATLAFNQSQAHAGFWDWSAGLVTSTSDYVSGWWNDDEISSESSDVDSDEGFLEQTEEDTGSDDDLSLSFMSPLPISYISSIGSFFSPALDFGKSLFGFKTCPTNPWSMCAYCFNLGFSTVMDVYDNVACKQLYDDMPALGGEWKRSEEKIESMCKCQEDNNDIFKDEKVAEFMKNAVALKKEKMAEQIVANIKTIAKHVGLAKAHPYFNGTQAGKPSNACLHEKFPDLIKGLTTPDESGKSHCQPASVAKLLKSGAAKAEACKNAGDDNKPADCVNFEGFEELALEKTQGSAHESQIEAMEDEAELSHLGAGLSRVMRHHYESGLEKVYGRTPASTHAPLALDHETGSQSSIASPDVEQIYAGAAAENLKNAINSKPAASYSTMREILSKDGDCEETASAGNEGKGCLDLVSQLKRDPYLGQILEEVELRNKNQSVSDKNLVKAFNNVMKLILEKNIDEKKVILDQDRKSLRIYRSEFEQETDEEKKENLREKIAFTDKAIEIIESEIPTYETILNASKGTAGDDFEGAVQFFVQETWKDVAGENDSACVAIQREIQMYCKLEEEPSSYRASDILELDFDKNHEIGFEFAAKSKDDSADAKDMTALLDTLTCIEGGQFSKYPANEKYPTYITAEGRMSTCLEAFTEDDFPSAINGKVQISRYRNKKWKRCGGGEALIDNEKPAEEEGDGGTVDPTLATEKRFAKSQSSNSGSRYNFKGIEKKSLDDILKGYKSSGYSPKYTPDEMAKIKSSFGGGPVEEKKKGFMDRVKSGGALADSASGIRGADVAAGASGENGRDSGSSQQTNNSDGVVSAVNGTSQLGNRIQEIDRQIAANNQEIIEKGDKESNIVEDNKDSDKIDDPNSAISAELKSLREQIEELKQQNEKLALERKLEIEKMKKEQLEREILAQKTPTPALIPEPEVTVGGSQSAIVTNSSQGDSSSVSAPTGSELSSVSSSSGSNSIVPSSLGSTSSSNSIVSGSDSGVSLKAVDASGNVVNFSSGDVLNLDSRSDVSNLDAAVTIALKSNKGAFVYQGKYYVKKGEKFVQVSDIKSKGREVASEDKAVESIDDVEKLLEKYKKTEDEAEALPGPKPESVVRPATPPSRDVKDEADASSRERSYVDKLWNIFDTAGRNLFNFGSN